jgi:hypothetical protein
MSVKYFILIIYMENPAENVEVPNVDPNVNSQAQEAQVQEAQVQEAQAQEAQAEEAQQPADTSENFRLQLVQGFKNVIARQNAMSRLTKDEKTTKIMNVIQKVQQMPNLGENLSGALIPTMDFEKAVFNGFLNNIVRKNMVQKRLNKVPSDQRTIAIQAALTEIQGMPDVGSYILQSFGDAYSTTKNVFLKKGGKKTRKGGKKIRKGGKTRKCDKKTRKGGKTRKCSKKIRRGGKKTKMTKKW